MRRPLSPSTIFFGAFLNRHKDGVLQNAISGTIFILFFLLNFGGFSVVGQTPNYTHDAANSRNLDEFTLTVADALNPEAKLNRLIISVDTNPEGERFVLTFGNGIKRVGDNGLIDFIPNQNNRLSNAMDFAINSEGKFFVATNESNRRFIRVYSPEGVYLPNESLGDGTFGTGANKFRGPVGLAFDNEDNLYVADHYIGNQTPPSNPSFIKIYRKDASGSYKNNLINEFDNVQGTLLNFPYRLAVNSQGHLYMAELGPDGDASVKVLQFDNNFNPTQIDEISGNETGSPGSIVIDKFDNIFIADLGEDLDLARVLGATDDVDEFYEIFEIIRDGIADNSFNIDVYNPDNTYRSTISSQIDFPIDLAISNCGTLYVNNAFFDGEITEKCIFGYCIRVPDIFVDFDLEAYERSLGYDTEDPIIDCPNEVITLSPDEDGNYLLPDYSDLVTDNCDDNPAIIQNPEREEPISGIQTVTITAEDEAGNISTCSFQVEAPEEDEEEDTPPEAICNDFEVRLDENGIAEITAEQVYGGNDDLDLSIDVDSFDCSNLGANTVVLTVTDRDTQLSDSCEATITVVDERAPVANCAAPFTVELDEKGEASITVADIDSGSSDNCEISSRTLSQYNFTRDDLGVVPVTLTITDSSGRTDQCTVNITVEEEDTPPEAICNDFEVSLDENGIAGITAEQVYGGNEDLDLSIDIDSFDCSNLGANTVVLTVTDRDTQLSDSCEATITVVDERAPVANCAAPFTVELDENGEASITVADVDSGSTDDCDISSRTLSQYNFTRDDLGVVPVTLTITDSSGRTDQCTVNITVEEETPPEAVCNNFQVFLDENGVAQITAEQVYGGSEALDLIIDVDSFDCSNLGVNTVVLTVTDPDTGLSDTCEAIVTVMDNEAPVFDVCIENEVQEGTLENGEFILPDYRERITAIDNCGVAYMTQDPVPGTAISSDTYIHVFAYDEAGNESKSCSFELRLSEEPDPLEVSCPGDQTEDLQGNCTFTIPDYTEMASASPGAEITQSPAEGTLIDENTTVRLTASLDGATDSCSFEVILTGQPELNISCPGDQSENADAEGHFSLPDYTDYGVVTGDCSEFSVTQTPAAGTVIEEDTMVTLTVADAEGNTDSCNFQVQLVQSEPDPLEISCPEDQIEDLQGNCTFTIPDYTEMASANAGAEVTQSPAVGTLVDENTTVRLTASLDGATDSCNFEVILTDQPELSISCPGDQSENADAEGRFSLPDYTDEGIVSGDCAEFTVTQAPVEGTVIEEDTRITLTATDADGNENSCSFEVQLVQPEEPDSLEISCPEDQTEDLQGNCTFTIPDYTEMASASRGAEITQFPAEGTVVDENTTVRLTASLDGATESCSFEVILRGQPELNISCPGDQSENADAEGHFSLPDYTDYGVVTGDCSEFSVTQTPAAGTVIEEDTMVTLTVTDADGNEDSCSFEVQLVQPEEPYPLEISCPADRTVQPESNCEYTVPDFRGEVVVNNSEATIIQSPQPGEIISESTEVVLTATLGGETASCSFQLELQDNTPPIARCVSDFTLHLNEEGYGMLSETIIDNGSTDNCGIESMSINKTRFTTADVGEQTVSLTVMDAAGNIATCESTITVEPYDEENSGVSCVDSLTLPLSEAGDFVLTLNYTGNPEYEEVEISKTNFTCEDTGITQTITATYWGEYTGSCEIAVTVIDDLPPQVTCVSGLELQLGEDGTGTISEEQLEFSATDNCGVDDISFSRLNFTTADIGEQEITITVTDESGNRATCTTTVNVTAEEDPDRGLSCVGAMTLELDEQGEAYLNPEDIYNGDETVPPDLEVSRSYFDCEDIGTTEVELTATYPDGNVQTCTIPVTILDPEDHCATIPVDPDPLQPAPYVIIYPNPGKGIVHVETSEDVVLRRAEVFDMRGRFLLAKDFYDPLYNSQLDTSIDLRKYQSGVYTIVYYAEDEKFIRRAVISLY